MATPTKLDKLREAITESLRVQRDTSSIQYVDAGTALQDASSKQNHAIFARRGCGKTLLLHNSIEKLKPGVKAIYLNCEDFKRHSFPNVLIEILRSIFTEAHKNLSGWFGKKKKLRSILEDILKRLDELQRSADEFDRSIREKSVSSNDVSVDGGIEAGGAKINSRNNVSSGLEVEQSFTEHRVKIEELDRWLPELKRNLREVFELSATAEAIIIQIDDLYHLKRNDQAFVLDYIHRLCKDLPMYFKVATLRHVSTLYVEREGQPIGIQERHDFQPLNIDYTFSDFPRTRSQNRSILLKYGEKVGLAASEVDALFKGEGFSRLVMAGGGVPRDFLSLFLQLLSEVSHGNKIGKDEVRLLARQNFEQKIEELKQDSKADEQDDLIRGIYTIRRFCLDRKTNVFVVKEKDLQTADEWRKLIYRLLDYRIIHNCATALTHKSLEGTYQAFAVDIGCYANLRKLEGKFNEIDLSQTGAKEKMRSTPQLDLASFERIKSTAPTNAEQQLYVEEA